MFQPHCRLYITLNMYYLTSGLQPKNICPKSGWIHGTSVRLCISPCLCKWWGTCPPRGPFPHNRPVLELYSVLVHMFYNSLSDPKNRQISEPSLIQMKKKKVAYTSFSLLCIYSVWLSCQLKSLHSGMNIHLNIFTDILSGNMSFRAFCFEPHIFSRACFACYFWH